MKKLVMTLTVALMVLSPTAGGADVVSSECSLVSAGQCKLMMAGANIRLEVEGTGNIQVVALLGLIQIASCTVEAAPGVASGCTAETHYVPIQTPGDGVVVGTTPAGSEVQVACSASIITVGHVGSARCRVWN